MRALRPPQELAIATLIQSLASGFKRPMIQAPTGFGKTLLAAHIVDGAMRKGNRVIFTVPALSLVDQTVEAFWKEGLRDVGVIQGNHEMTSWHRPIQVASIQTLMRRNPIPDATFVVVDEAHRWFDFYATWMGMEDWRKRPFIGLSASPWTKGLGKYYDDLIIAATTQQLIDSGYLSPFRVFAPSHPDMTGVRTVAGDYHEGDLSGAMDKPDLTADVVETWLKLGERRPTLCFAVDRAHARHIQERFIAAGVGCGYIDAYTEVDERESIHKQLMRGEIEVVANVGCLTTGIDWDIRCIILARPTKSEMLYVQIIGRGLRTAEGKDHLIILDHSDTTLRLGFVTDIHHDKLNDGKPRPKAQAAEREEVLPKECPKCSFLKPAKVRACPHCGFAPQVQSSVICEDGELVELTGKRIQRDARGMPLDERRAWHAMLLGYAQDHGKSDKWVLANFREKFSEWPPKGRCDPLPPSKEVLSWIKSRMIAWAKRKVAA